MAKRREVEKQIRIVEGFNVRIQLPDGSAVPIGTYLKPYSKLFNKGPKQTWTVREWKDKKFRPHYEGFAVSVRRGDGTKPRGNTLLRTVRKTYYE